MESSAAAALQTALRAVEAITRRLSEIASQTSLGDGTKCQMPHSKAPTSLPTFMLAHVSDWHATSLAGVRREMSVALPLQIAAIVAAAGLWVTGRFL